MNLTPVILLGASGHAKVIIDIFRRDAQHEVVGIIDATLPKASTFYEIPILGKDVDLIDITKAYPNALYFIAVGDNWVRHRIYEKLIAAFASITFANAIHPSASIAENVELGQGIAVMAGAIINSASSIADFAIINTKASIDHDGYIGKFASIAPGATLGGKVNVGDFAAVSIGATVKHNTIIGQHALVGAGSVVVKDVSDFSISYGVPCRHIRFRKVGDPYL
jgi:sugar O-acyltransferase (sialic acid O-acetyltransferase NeuD family)